LQYLPLLYVAALQAAFGQLQRLQPNNLLA